MDGDVKSAEDLVSQLNLQVLKSYKVEISSNNKEWDNYILVITNSQFILCQYEKLDSYFWKTISRFEYNTNKLYINFEEKGYIIQSRNILNLASDLCEVFQRVLLPTELARIDFSIINTPLVGVGTESVDSRYLMQNAENLSSGECKKVISSLSKYGNPLFRISNASEVGFFLPVYLDLLPFIKTLKTIEIPIIGVDYMKLISNFPLELRYAHKIEINGSIGAILFTFLERLKQNQKQSKLNSLSFSLSNFNRNDLTAIAKAITGGPINSIEFHRAFHQSSSSFFYSSFLSHQINGLLWILNLDRTTGLDLKKLFPKIRNVPFVSLAYCHLDIIETLTVASQSKMEKLTILNLSGNNTVSSSLEKVENLMEVKSLKKLILDDINWSDHFTSQFLSVIFDRYQNNFSLSLSNGKASKEEWSEVFDFFKDSQYNGLIGFSWCNNPINTKLFQFLRRNDHLRRIDFDLCFTDNSADLVDDFSSLVKDLPDLRILSAAGSKEKHIGHDVAKVIESCTGHKSIHTLNVPYSYGGDDSLPLFESLIESTPTLKIINFECLGLTDHSAFLDVMMKLSQKKLKVSFPTEDLKGFRNLISKDDQEALKNAYRISYRDPPFSDDQKFAIPQANEPLLNKKRLYYKYFKKPSFPSYVTDKTIQKLKLELVSIPDKISDKPNFDKLLNSSSSLQAKSEKKKPQIMFQTGRPIYNSNNSNGSLTKVNSKLNRKRTNDDEDDEDDQSTSTDKNRLESVPESEHPFESVDEYGYSDPNDKEGPNQRSNPNKPKPTIVDRTTDLSPKETPEEENNEVKIDLDDNSFSSISYNNVDQYSRRSNNLPKNLPKNCPFPDFDSEEVYDQSPIKSPNSSKVTATEVDNYDSLSETDSIDGVVFEASPIFKNKKYNFSSEIFRTEESSEVKSVKNKKDKKEPVKVVQKEVDPEFEEEEEEGEMQFFPEGNKEPEKKEKEVENIDMDNSLDSSVFALGNLKFEEDSNNFDSNVFAYGNYKFEEASNNFDSDPHLVNKEAKLGESDKFVPKQNHSVAKDNNKQTIQKSPKKTSSPKGSPKQKDAKNSPIQKGNQKQTNSKNSDDDDDDNYKFDLDDEYFANGKSNAATKAGKGDGSDEEKSNELDSLEDNFLIDIEKYGFSEDKSNNFDSNEKFGSQPAGNESSQNKEKSGNSEYDSEEADTGVTLSETYESSEVHNDKDKDKSLVIEIEQQNNDPIEVVIDSPKNKEREKVKSPTKVANSKTKSKQIENGNQPDKSGIEKKDGNQKKNKAKTKSKITKKRESRKSREIENDDVQRIEGKEDYIENENMELLKRSNSIRNDNDDSNEYDSDDQKEGDAQMLEERNSNEIQFEEEESDQFGSDNKKEEIENTKEIEKSDSKEGNLEHENEINDGFDDQEEVNQNKPARSKEEVDDIIKKVEPTKSKEIEDEIPEEIEDNQQNQPTNSKYKIDENAKKIKPTKSRDIDNKIPEGIEDNKQIRPANSKDKIDNKNTTIKPTKSKDIDNEIPEEIENTQQNQPTHSKDEIDQNAKKIKPAKSKEEVDDKTKKIKPTKSKDVDNEIPEEIENAQQKSKEKLENAKKIKPTKSRDIENGYQAGAIPTNNNREIEEDGTHDEKKAPTKIFESKGTEANLLSSSSSSTPLNKLTKLSEEETSRNDHDELEILQTSSDNDEEPMTPTTPKLSLFSKNIISFNDEGDFYSSNTISRSAQATPKSTNAAAQGTCGDHDWTFPIYFNMKPDLSEFKKIEEEYAPNILYDNLYNEKRISSKNKK